MQVVGKYILMLIAAVVVLKSLHTLKSEKQQTELSSRTASEFKLQNCEGKKLCITVYIAPWCGVCNQSIPTFRAVHEHLPQLRSQAGFGLVVGGNSATSTIDDKIKELKPLEAFNDNTDKLIKYRRIRAFPTWIVTDDKGKEIFRRPGGGPTAPTKESVEALLKDMGI
jgi:thiol-disulfide isomerase/thioredoxin